MRRATRTRTRQHTRTHSTYTSTYINIYIHTRTNREDIDKYRQIEIQKHSLNRIFPDAGKKNRRCTWTVNAVKAPPGRFVVVHRWLQPCFAFPRFSTFGVASAVIDPGKRGGGARSVPPFAPLAFALRTFRSRGEKEGGTFRFGIFSESTLCVEKKLAFSIRSTADPCSLLHLFEVRYDGSLLRHCTQG